MTVTSRTGRRKPARENAPFLEAGHNSNYSFAHLAHFARLVPDRYPSQREFASNKALVKKLVTKSNSCRYNEDKRDYLDKSIIENIERISENHEVCTMGSCSGIRHEGSFAGEANGYPFVSLVFCNESSKKKYIQLFKRIGESAMHWGDLSPYCFLGSVGRLDEVGAKQLWERWTKVLER